MRDWDAYVRRRFPCTGFEPAEASRVVRELAAQLEDFNRDALASGLDESEADRYARRQIPDWDRMARDLARADRRLAVHGLERWAGHVDDLAQGAPRRWMMMAGIWQDLRHAVRQFVKRPAFAAVVVLTLAVGIGAATAMFSVLDGVLLRPLPYPDPDRLVRVFEIVPQYGRFSVAPASYFDWRQQNTVFDHIAAYSSGSVTLSDGVTADRLASAGVSWDLFAVLQAAPALGRTFTEEEDLGPATVVVLSDRVWRSRFAGDPGVVGRQLTLNNAPVTVVGVMPPDFYFPSHEIALWTPLGINPVGATRGGHYLGVVARLKADRSIDDARTEMKGLAERLAAAYPDNSAGESAGVIGLHEDTVRTARPSLLTLLAAVALMMLIACANVASLLLVRASAGGRDIAVRMALGAGTSRVVRQMLTESLWLASVGGAIGVGLAYAALGPIRAAAAGSLPRTDDITIDIGVLAFAVATSILTGLVFGAAPAWQASRAGVADALKDAGRSGTSAGGQRIRSALVIGEVALSLVLLIGAALLIRSFAKLTAIDPGFDPNGVLTFHVSLPNGPNPTARRIQYYTELVDRVRALPSVTAVGLVQQLPLQGQYVLSVDFEGRPTPAPGAGVSANYRAINPDYFAALGVALDRGRLFTERDREGAPLVAIVDEAFVRRHFPREDPIGHRLDIGNGSDGLSEIVGIVGDVRQDGLDAESEPTMYVPFGQAPTPSVTVLVRTARAPLALTPAVRDVMQRLDRGVPPYRIASLEQVVNESVAGRRFPMQVLGLFALIALFLAGVGLYGVLSYTVTQRTREIGVRLAIGAAPPQVWRLVIGQGLKLTLVGIALGMAGALALSQLVTAMLFDVTPFDPVSYLAMGLVLLIVAGLACYVPARRAMRVDPLVALRAE